MKAADIQQCAVCKQGLMHSGMPLFWRIKLQRMGFDRTAIHQVAGLEMMMGSVALARVMGPDPDIAKAVGEERSILVCETCAGEQTSVYELGLEEDDGSATTGESIR